MDIVRDLKKRKKLMFQTIIYVLKSHLHMQALAFWGLLRLFPAKQFTWILRLDFRIHI